MGTLYLIKVNGNPPCRWTEKIWHRIHLLINKINSSQYKKTTIYGTF